MNQLEKTLAQKKKKILNKWIELIADSHPAGSKLLEDKDQFTNPVGYILSSETSVLYDQFLADQLESDEAIVALNSIIRIRAVQDFPPSEAAGFVFLLKDIVRKESKEFRETNDIRLIEDRIDRMACLAFDAYSHAREKINEIRINEIKSSRDSAFKLLERMVLKHGDLEDTKVSSYNGSEVTE